MNLDQALQTFIIESRELLEDMESALLAVEKAESKSEMVNAIFRAAHTIKGSSGLFGLDNIVKFTHVVESVLDYVRDGKISITEELVARLLACCDHTNLLIDAVAAGQLDPDAATEQRGEVLLEQLRSHASLVAGNICLPVAGEGAEQGVPTAELPARDHWHISIRFGSEVFRNGMDPISFIRYLGKLGTISYLVTLPDAIPPANEMNPESCYLGFEISLLSDADKTTIENVFEFVQDDCRLRIVPPHSKTSEYLRLIKELTDEAPRLGEILVRSGSITPRELESALQAQSNIIPERRIGDILVEQGIVLPEMVEAALARQKQVKELKTQEHQSMRVDADKLDALINLVGELIIAAASVNLVARRTKSDELQETTSVLSSLVEEVRDSALQLRMVKIGATFNRFQRVVHDVSREIGKDICLVVNGEDTELDKTLVEKIADPLTHLVRNAIDHGIEPAEVRIANGKPAQGIVKLNAYHDSGSIVIEVSDDGGGLKRDRILAKAIERGLVDPARSLYGSEIDELIFEPGFSTAEEITNLSGRGVGMDVVKRNIVALRGSVNIASEEGAGTTVTIRLPLTLAIIDGFLVGVGKSAFVIPLEMVEECVEFTAEPGHDYTNLRGQVLPFIQLREIFSVEGASSRRQSIVIIRHAGIRAGLVVDVLHGEFQTVIKPLGRRFNRVKCISGSSILGNGEVALILDIPALLRQAVPKNVQPLAA